MVKGKFPISDAALVRWFKDKVSSESFRFVGMTSKFQAQVTKLKKSTSDLVNDLKEDKLLHEEENLKTILPLWQNLLGDAIIFLKHEDEREVYHDGEIFGTDSLMKVLAKLREFEPVLYGAESYYRDHIVHPFRVFLLGCYVMEEYLTPSQIDVGDDDLGSTRKITEEEKRAMWCIIALTHDIGYGLARIDKLNQQTGEMIKAYGKASVQELSYAFPPQRESIDSFVLKFISSSLRKKGHVYYTHLQSKFFLKFCRAYEDLDHGVISCTVLMRDLVYFLESDFTMDALHPLNSEEAKQFLIRQNILRSIASHNCDSIYYVKAKTFPFLLMIIDEMQMWGRPRLADAFKVNMPEITATLVQFESRERKKDKCIEEIAFEVKFELKTSDKGIAEQSSEQAMAYFQIKAQKLIKVLRSGVAGPKKNIIVLTFTVVDDSRKQFGKTVTYEFKLKEPKPKSDTLEIEFLQDGVNVSSLYDLKSCE